MAKKVKYIPASRQKFTAEPVTRTRKKRVAGYARVSTDHEEQATSYEAQVRYYTEYIRGRDDWVFAGMYADEGISATSTKHRDGFNQMIDDALDGKLDLIITKSVSRFARNTVDSLTTVRKLKEKGIEVYFEKENIWTLDSKGELLITIMSSLAQEESRSISENTTWGQRRRFADGKASVAYSHFLGYGPGFTIIEEQAETVRLIYRLYLSGLSSFTIAKRLEGMGRPAPYGGKRWYADSVRSILQNEKYKGDALLQKTYTVDFLSKKVAENNGEVPQYYVEGHHEGIIDPQTFELVQAEIKRRQGRRSGYSGGSIFSSKIICGDCGSFYGPKVWHSNDKYRRMIWRCNSKYKKVGKQKCSTPSLSEDEIKGFFIRALKKLIRGKDSVIADMEILRSTAADVAGPESDLVGLEAEIDSLSERLQLLIAENARIAQDQSDYEKRYRELMERYEERKRRHTELTEQIAKAKAADKIIGHFIDLLWQMNEAEIDFDENLWGGMVESITVHSKEKVTVTFKGGYKVKVIE